LIAGTGPQPDGDLFEFATGALKQTQARIVDEHYYRPPAWFRENAARYDGYDRKGYKVFAGEYAAQSISTASPVNRNNWNCALSEAAFMTGLERNADIVVMCSYAPLFAHVDGWQWTPDLIWFDNLTVYGTPNYYVQKLFSTNRGTYLLSMLQENQPLIGQQGLYGSAALDKPSGDIILKLVNTGDFAIDRTFILQTPGRVASEASLTLLQHASPDAINSIDSPRTVEPVEREIILKGKKVTLSIPAYSFSVIRIKLK
jgi:alpha-N-arabinofuranosidase